MRWTRWFAIALACMAVAVAAVALAATTAKTKAASSAASKVERGRYLVTIMGCNDCHTPGTFYGAPDMTRFLSGSEMGWSGPWGVVYSANLTPDKETGLARYTDAQVITMIRTGNRPDGRQLAPIMPWMDFSTLTDADVHAVVAFLRSLPAVSHHAPAPVPPGQQVSGAVVFPPPSEWDARNLPKPPGGEGK